MTKAELVKELKLKANMESTAQAERAYEALFDLIANALQKGDDLTISGFGTFKVTHRAARKGRNPRTGEVIDIPASKSVTFKPGKALREAL